MSNLLELEERVRKLEEMIKNFNENYSKQIHIYPSNICHFCFSDMELLEKSETFGLYRCINTNCVEYNKERLISYPNLDLLCYLKGHQG